MEWFNVHTISNDDSCNESVKARVNVGGNAEGYENQRSFSRFGFSLTPSIIPCTNLLSSTQRVYNCLNETSQNVSLHNDNSLK